MRLNTIFRLWLNDKEGLVLVFSALVLPLILLLGVLVLQSGQLYQRQAQLQFVARQAASSGLVPLAEKLKTAAELNYQTQCQTDFPPEICNASNWTDFLTADQAQTMAQQSDTFELVKTEIENFIVTTDPRQSLQPSAVNIVFPVQNGAAGKIQARVEITEPQTAWLGNVLRPDDYSITVQALSYLSLQS